MKWLTLEAKLTCKHITGVVQLLSLQTLVTIQGVPVLVKSDPERKIIVGCANLGPTIKPCSLTLPVEKGYSEWIRIEGHPVCLDILTGFTDGTPPGVVKYVVRNPGQGFVEELP